MSSPSSLAPRHDDQCLSPSNPFATPTRNPAALPARPEPAAHTQPLPNPTLPRPGQPTSQRSAGRLHHDPAAFPYKSASMSSAGSSTMTPLASIDLEKSRLATEHKQQHRTSKDRTARDPEKDMNSPSPGTRDRGARRGSDEQRVAYLEDDDTEESRQRQERKAVKILLFLSGPCVVLSFLNAVWALISLAITSMTQPVRLCARRPTFGQQLGGLLGPALNLQLKSIYTPLPPHADEDTSYHSGMLVLVQLLSPFLSMGVMIAAWIVAVFWVSSAVVGDPAGTDKRDDGRETVLALRSWWEMWLVRSVREQ